jgi:hypothetical protein
VKEPFANASGTCRSKRSTSPMRIDVKGHGKRAASLVYTDATYSSSGLAGTRSSPALPQRSGTTIVGANGQPVTVSRRNGTPGRNFSCRQARRLLRALIAKVLGTRQSQIFHNTISVLYGRVTLQLPLRNAAGAGRTNQRALAAIACKNAKAQLQLLKNAALLERAAYLPTSRWQQEFAHRRYTSRQQGAVNCSAGRLTAEQKRYQLGAFHRVQNVILTQQRLDQRARRGSFVHLPIWLEPRPT